ncbi:hypothetical protein ABH944_005440 [Caballeronia udeis]|uniref:Uncharacterized protein n=1 Tax=Caballeronia udeis TaxID=1232866 RepID=A0ABW8MPE5_9BURK
MTQLPRALTELIPDPQGKRAEEAILSVVVGLEREGVPPKTIAKAMARVLLSFCVRQGSIKGSFGWVSECLDALGRALEWQAEKNRRAWVRRFLQKTGRLYRDAWTEIEIASPPPDKIAEDQLRTTNPHGSA